MQLLVLSRFRYEMWFLQESDEEHPGHYKVSPETHEKLVEAGRKGAATRNAKAKQQVLS